MRRSAAGPPARLRLRLVPSPRRRVIAVRPRPVAPDSSARPAPHPRRAGSSASVAPRSTRPRLLERRERRSAGTSGSPRSRRVRSFSVATRRSRRASRPRRQVLAPAANEPAARQTDDRNGHADLISTRRDKRERALRGPISPPWPAARPPPRLGRLAMVAGARSPSLRRRSSRRPACPPQPWRGRRPPRPRRPLPPIRSVRPRGRR